MNKNQKIVAVVIVVVVLAVAGFWLFTPNNESQREIRDLLNEYNLDESQRIDLEAALKLLEENPNDPAALITIARVRDSVGDTGGAIEIYNRVIENQPTNTLALHNLADIYSRMEDWEQAEGIYLKIIAQTPKWLDAYRDLMSIYRYHLPSKYSEMEGILLNAIEVTADITDYAPVDLYLMLASYYERTDNIDQAIKYYEIALEVMPDNKGAKTKLDQLQ